MMGMRELGKFQRKACTCERHARREAIGSPVHCSWALKELPGKDMH